MPNVLINIYTDEKPDQSVNVNNATKLGAKLMNEFQKDLPGTFRKSLTTKVVLKTSTKDKRGKIKVDKDECNTDLLLAHVLLLLGINQLELNQAFSCELAPVPTSLF